MTLLASIEFKISASAVLVVVPQCEGAPDLLLFTTDLLLALSPSSKATGDELNSYLILLMQDLAAIGSLDPDDNYLTKWQATLASHVLACFKGRVNPEDCDPLGLNCEPDE